MELLNDINFMVDSVFFAAGINIGNAFSVSLDLKGLF
jgi:hypothetical protein